MSEVSMILGRVDNAVSASIRGVLDPIQEYIESADSKMEVITTVLRSLPEYKALKEENERLKTRLEELEQGLRLKVSIPPARPSLNPLQNDPCILDSVKKPTPIMRGLPSEESVRALEAAVSREAELVVSKCTEEPQKNAVPEKAAGSPQPKVSESDLIEIEVAEEDEDGNEFDRTYFTDDEVSGLLYEKSEDGNFVVVGRFVDGDPEFTAFDD